MTTILVNSVNPVIPRPGNRPVFTRIARNGPLNHLRVRLAGQPNKDPSESLDSVRELPELPEFTIRVPKITSVFGLLASRMKRGVAPERRLRAPTTRWLGPTGMGGTASPSRVPEVSTPCWEPTPASGSRRWSHILGSRRSSGVGVRCGGGAESLDGMTDWTRLDCTGF